MSRCQYVCVKLHIYDYDIYIYNVVPCEFLMVACDTPASAYGGFTDEFDKRGKKVSGVIYHPITKNSRQLGGSNTLDANGGLSRF